MAADGHVVAGMNIGIRAGIFIVLEVAAMFCMQCWSLRRVLRPGTVRALAV